MASASKTNIDHSSSEEIEKYDFSELKSVIDSAEPWDCFKPASSRQALVQSHDAYKVTGICMDMRSYALVHCCVFAKVAHWTIKLLSRWCDAVCVRMYVVCITFNFRIYHGVLG